MIFLRAPGADNAAEDCIYSAYFHQYSGDGVYSVRAVAKGNGGETQILREIRELQPDAESEGYKGMQALFILSSLPKSPIT